MNATASKGRDLLIRWGAEQYLATYPRATQEQFGFLADVDAYVSSVDEDGVTVMLRIPTKAGDVIDVFAESPTEVRMSFDDFGHWIHLLSQCTRQHGDETTKLFFAR